MLQTGCDHHVAGFGNMEEFLGPKQKGKPGYEGHLNDRVVPIAKVLHDAGYHTFWAGKSHMSYDKAQWPVSMGLERDFTLLQGGGSNFSDMSYPNPAHPHLNFTLNGKPLDKLPMITSPRRLTPTSSSSALKSTRMTASRSLPTSASKPCTRLSKCRMTGSTNTRAFTTKATMPSARSDSRT
jgi:hypothetical protein